MAILMHVHYSQVTYEVISDYAQDYKAHAWVLPIYIINSHYVVLFGIIDT